MRLERIQSSSWIHKAINYIQCLLEGNKCSQSIPDWTRCVFPRSLALLTLTTYQETKVTLTPMCFYNFHSLGNLQFQYWYQTSVWFFFFKTTTNKKLKLVKNTKNTGTKKKSSWDLIKTIPCEPTFVTTHHVNFQLSSFHQHDVPNLSVSPDC